MKTAWISLSVLMLTLLSLSGCYAYRDKGVNAAQQGANPEQGVLNSLNAKENAAVPASPTKGQ